MTVTQIYTNMHKDIPIMSTSTKIKIPKTIQNYRLGSSLAQWAGKLWPLAKYAQSYLLWNLKFIQFLVKFEA